MIEVPSVDVGGYVRWERRGGWSGNPSQVSSEHASMCLESDCQAKVRKSPNLGQRPGVWTYAKVDSVNNLVSKYHQIFF